MCDIAIVDGVVCETRGELERAIGARAVSVSAADYPDWPAYCCLCPCDFEATAKLAGYEVSTNEWADVVFTKVAA